MNVKGSSTPPNVPVIALFPLIVVAQDTFTFHHEGPPVLKKGARCQELVGRCHGTTSKKVASSVTVRDFSISLAFMLPWKTTDKIVVNQNNTRLKTHR